MSLAIISTRRLCVLATATAALLSAGSALAVDLYGGGATFPAVAYLGDAYLTPNPDARLSSTLIGSPVATFNNPGAGFSNAGIETSSIFGAFTGPPPTPTHRVSYCQTGSGFGKQTLTGAVSAAQSCRDFGTGVSPAGLSTPAGQAQPDFTGTDAPISTSDYTAFNNNTTLAAARVGIVQVPSLAGAIALPYNASVNGVTKLQLTVPQVCAIFSGLVTNWTNIRSDGTYNTSTGTAVGSGLINVTYRSDGSGTTFAFTSFLAAKCNGTVNVPAGKSFSPNQSYTAATAGITYGASSAQSGNNGVVTAVRTTSNAIGYADFGEVASQLTLPAPNNLRYANVGTTSATYYDPAAFGGGSSVVAINTTYLKEGFVLDGATLNPVPGAPPAAAKNCLLVVDPAAPISGTYPIAAITYLNSYYSGNGSASKIAALKGLLGIFYNTSTRPSLPAGFAYVSGNAVFSSRVTGKISTCIN